jgi:catechol 2,3-dioxygenase-like lactoylglutathione lyase family enzyme
MLTRVDRVQLVVRDREAAAETYKGVFEAAVVSDDEVAALGAKRRTVRAGTGEFELLEPAGPGPVQEFLDRRGEGLFAAGFATPRVDVLAGHFDAHGVRYTTSGSQLLLDANQTRGMRVVISADGRTEPPAGSVISHVYEVTNVVDDAQQAEDLYALIFGLDRSYFCPIESEHFGYRGVLTLFDPPGRLDRIEAVEITDPSLAMGRFHARHGPSLYMCFIEVEEISRLTARLKAAGKRYAGDVDGENNSIFIHPSAIHGMLMGVSRTTVGWSWSGHPELVTAP